MPTGLRTLILEDRVEDAELCLHELRRGGFEPVWERVQTRDDFLARLNSDLDIILSDFSMPGFNAPQALALLRESGIDVPLIIVTGTISEEVAVESIKLGAEDYLLKDRLGRLSQSVTQALERRRIRIQNRLMADALARRDQIMQAVGFAAEQFLTADDVDSGVDEVMQRLGAATSASRILLFENYQATAELSSVKLRAKWFHDETLSRVDDPWMTGGPMQSGGFGRWSEVLASGAYVQGTISTLPPAEAELLAAHGVRSILMLPIFVGSIWWGQIAFEDCVTERDWYSSEIDAVKVAVRTLGAAIQRNSTEEALRRSEEQLQQSQKMEAIGTLAGGIAHDFNNLLTAILGNTQLAVMSKEANAGLQRRLFEIEKAGKRATALTRQLLAFSRRQRLQRRSINLNETIREVFSMIERIIGEDIEIQFKGEPGLSPVFADPAQIEQVIMNLAVNARDAMLRGGTLTVETFNGALDETYCRKYPYVKPGAYVVTTISDTGTGMSEDIKARIFEPFFTTKEVGKGTGLGLAMVYGIVKQHEGHIHVYSELGHGTTFRVYLPVAGEPQRGDAYLEKTPVVGGDETILVAEDEGALRALAGDVLEALGYKVLIAQNGEECVEMFAASSDSISLLLLDVVMPRMGGHAAYEKIHAISPNVPVIFMTGYSAETVQSRFLDQNRFIEDLGAPLLQKPYNVEDLGRKVRDVLDARTVEASADRILTDTPIELDN